ncbi:MAG: DMT family transporter [Pseudomonadota bacterium]|nr:DMT family transporter [Pseudomonadota bacterium]
MAYKHNSDARSAIPYWVAFIFLIIGAFSWAGSSVAGRMASGNLPPFSLSFIRWILVAICFLAIGGKETWQQRHLILKHWKLLTAFGFFGVVGFTVPYYVGLQFTVAVNASLMNASGTLWIVTTAFLMTGDTVTRKQTIGIVLGFFGTIFIVARADIAVLANFSINIGDLMVLVAFFSWAVYTVMLRWKPSEIGELAFLTSMTIFAVILMSPLYLVDLAQGKTFEKNFDNLAIITYAVIFPSFISYLLWNKAVPIVGASVAGVAQYLIPIIGVFLSVMLLGESIENYHVVGIAVIFTGVWLVSAGRRKHKKTTADTETGATEQK